MSNQPDNIIFLWTQFAERKASKEQIDLLFDYIKDATYDQESLAFLEQQFAEHRVSKGLDKAHLAEKLNEILTTADLKSTSFPPVHRIHFLRTGWFRYAAVLLLAVGIVGYFWNSTSDPSIKIKSNSSEIKLQLSADIKPGTNRAILTLSDGNIIQLDSATKGTLANQGTTKVIKLTDGSLSYRAKPATEAIGFNTISTPKGGQYQVNLPDGSKVWMNAASSIRFPTAYSTQRTVEVTGEVYIEIAKDRMRPFFVQVGKERIDVLGTSLNVNAYANEPAVVTTLLEGSIQIGKTLLKPGEAYVSGKKYKTEASRAIAWKNGQFDFQDMGLREVMRQLERWYNIDVTVASGTPDIAFYGGMSRDVTLEELLKALKRFDLNFTLEKRILIVRQ